jgi:hypothetical protein
MIELGREICANDEHLSKQLLPSEVIESEEKFVLKMNIDKNNNYQVK